MSSILNGHLPNTERAYRNARIIMTILVKTIQWLVKVHSAAIKKVIFMFLATGLHSPVGRAPDSYVRGPGFHIRFGHILTFLLRASVDSRRADVIYWRKYVHEVLVNRLGGLSLPRKSVVRLTDRLDMTLDVYRGRKTTTMVLAIFSNSDGGHLEWEN